MPEGVEVTVEDGLATIHFVDPEKRGPGLARLFEVGTPPELVEKRTRPTITYTVPEGNARLAGLLDDSDPAPEGDGKGYDDGLPDMDWSRKAIDDYAAKLTPALDTTGEANKHDAIEAIKAHAEAHPLT